MNEQFTFQNQQHHYENDDSQGNDLYFSVAPDQILYIIQTQTYILNSFGLK